MKSCEAKMLFKVLQRWYERPGFINQSLDVAALSKVMLLRETIPEASWCLRTECQQCSQQSSREIMARHSIHYTRVSLSNAFSPKRKGIQVARLFKILLLRYTQKSEAEVSKKPPWWRNPNVCTHELLTRLKWKEGERKMGKERKAQATLNTA